MKYVISRKYTWRTVKDGGLTVFGVWGDNRVFFDIKIAGAADIKIAGDADPLHPTNPHTPSTRKTMAIWPDTPKVVVLKRLFERDFIAKKKQEYGWLK